MNNWFHKENLIVTMKCFYTEGPLQRDSECTLFLSSAVLKAKNNLKVTNYYMCCNHFMEDRKVRCGKSN